jgi:glycosyltransferase involved in cell wall biosynthesis
MLRVHEEVNDDLLAQGLWQYSIQRDLAEIFPEFDLVIFPSEHTKRFYESLARRMTHGQRWLVIPNTINEEMTASGAGIHNGFRVLQLGSVSQRKNPLLTLTAFELFLDCYKPSNVELLFVGCRNANTRERDYVRLLRKEINAKNLAPYVKITPTHLFPGKDIFEASAVTLHSSSECSPTVFLEANFFGKNVIGPNIGGIAEIVTESVNGHLFEYGDCSAQARLIGQLYEQRQSLPTSIPRITEYYYSRFSNTLFFERIDAAIEELQLANN